MVIDAADQGVIDDDDDGEEISTWQMDENGEILPLWKKAPLKRQDWLGLAVKNIINSSVNFINNKSVNMVVI